MRRLQAPGLTAFIVPLLLIQIFLVSPSKAQDLSTLDYLKGTQLYQKAKGGDERSMYKLGLIYYYGDGENYFYSSEDGRELPVINFREAFYWLKKAGASGHLDSLYHFGLLNLEEAQGDFQLKDLGADRQTGFTALKAAAEGGHVLAMNDLSRFYMGEENNMERALYWEQRAADAGHIPSQYSIRMGDFSSASAGKQEEAVEWFLDFVYKNTGKFGVYAIGHIAEAHLKGIGGLPRDLVKAYAWQSLFVKYYPACQDSESFRKGLLREYETDLSSDEKKKALNMAEDIKKDIESRSQTRLRRLDFHCGG